MNCDRLLAVLFSVVTIGKINVKSNWENQVIVLFSRKYATRMMSTWDSGYLTHIYKLENDRKKIG